MLLCFSGCRRASNSVVGTWRASRVDTPSGNTVRATPEAEVQFLEGGQCLLKVDKGDGNVESFPGSWDIPSKGRIRYAFGGETNLFKFSFDHDEMIFIDTEGEQQRVRLHLKPIDAFTLE